MNTTNYQFITIFITIFLNILMKNEFSEDIKNFVIIIIISFINSIIIIKMLKEIRNSMYEFIIFTKEEIFFVNEDFIIEYCESRNINYTKLPIVHRRNIFNKCIQESEFISVKDENLEEVMIKSSNIIKTKFNPLKLNFVLNDRINFWASSKNETMSTIFISLIISVLYISIVKVIKKEGLILFLLLPSMIINLCKAILIRKSYKEAVKKNDKMYNEIFNAKIEEFKRNKH